MSMDVSPVVVGRHITGHALSVLLLRKCVNTAFTISNSIYEHCKYIFCYHDVARVYCAG